MLDINLIRQNPEKVKDGIAKKGFSPDLVDEFLRVDGEWRKLTTELDGLRATQNDISEKLQGGRNEELIARAKELKEEVHAVEAREKELEETRLKSWQALPNTPFSDVPVGRDEKDNKVLREIGKKPKFDFQPKDHLELGEGLGIIDFPRGAKVAGSGFYYLKGDAVLLELALVRYALDFLAKKGFELYLTPDVAKDKFYLGTGYAPKGPEAQTYTVEGSDLGLIATSEVTLAALHAGEVLAEDDLPKLYAGYSHCFRQEAGAYGKYSKGLYRVHQFTKVEMFAYTKPEDSEKIHQKLVALEEELWQGLGIPYRVLEMCTGDLGSQAARKFDLEAWMPGRNDCGEVTSVSNTTDYQSRRLNIKYRRKDGGLDFVHTLNGTALATSRAIVAILENYQRKDGSVAVPSVLQQYTGTRKLR